MGKEHLKGQYFPFSPENPGEFGILTAIKLGQISFFYIFSRKIVFNEMISLDIPNKPKFKKCPVAVSLRFFFRTRTRCKKQNLLPTIPANFFSCFLKLDWGKTSS